MYRYNCLLVFIEIKHNKKSNGMHREKFNKLPHTIKSFLRLRQIEYDFVMYNVNILIQRHDFITPFNDYMILIYCC